jgi:hypothetical protein
MFDVNKLKPVKKMTTRKMLAVVIFPMMIPIRKRVVLFTIQKIFHSVGMEK